MERYYKNTPTVFCEKDTINIGRIKFLLKKDCGSFQTNSDQEKAERIAADFFDLEYFYGKDSHCLVFVNCRVFAAIKINHNEKTQNTAVLKKVSPSLIEVHFDGGNKAVGGWAEILGVVAAKFNYSLENIKEDIESYLVNI